MGSRMMHYAIAQQLTPESTAFSIGSLAPDVSGHNFDFKSQTHYMTLNEDGKTRSIHPEMFAEEYQRQLLPNMFVCGYYAHLLEDKVWLDTVFNPFIRQQLNTQRDQKLAAYYADFHTLNLLIANHHKLQPLSVPDSAHDFTVVREIGDGDVMQVVKDLRDDFEPVPKRQLVMLSFDQIEQYINTCVQVVQDHLSALK
ncbi:MAG: hypothetical protein LKG79_08060 [Furfurilactobacillus sp.]|uniref:hypothetical protein n=1 Tax=Furfurilactobacillus sp. TaxID=2767911 RepID=UPI00258B4043|nr:hypothetical protein [Furfurilactobacillus sp.]MCH4012234.1 hypothetical protein [Furfurilactobacillus sp.]MCH4038126.1 hypothetical protein [Furfurilactobacillus sp.]MCH4115237.1 hypothetical protein [Furfurilactobacillus sp.]MCI1340053.1 hypothetical protein [Furfurilactobacillus sp.]MCI1387467.1 hypothetical protein [Furfurilactobacillus sp.]